jgi:catechol 2,3-dioxygenase-like lactoylglutathione lyase family enzyme
MRLEVVVIPVADVDRAKDFYKALGWREDAPTPSVSFNGKMLFHQHMQDTARARVVVRD